MAQSFKTSISFGLVYIPVTLHVTVKNNDIGFNMIHKKYKSRIKYQKTCDECGEESVKQADIVKGYEYDDDKYVLFTQEDFNKIKTNKDKSITIEQFSKLEDIDPIYFDKSYFVIPTGAEKAYKLIAKAMEDENKVAIAKTVLGTKETVIAIRSIKGALVLSTLFFFDEVQKNPLKLSKGEVNEKELVLTKQIIQTMDKKFVADEFKDEYRERLQKAIEEKISGNEITAIGEDYKPEKVINLMDALKKSLEKAEKKSKEPSDDKDEDKIVNIRKKVAK